MRLGEGVLNAVDLRQSKSRPARASVVVFDQALRAGITTISRAELDLAWIDNANNESGFKIESRAGSTCGNFSQIAIAGAHVNSYSTSGLKRNTTYRHRVLADNVPGDSADSHLVSGKTLR